MNDRLMKPPAPPTVADKPRPSSWLWPNTEQAQRAWAVTAACRLLAGSAHVHPWQYPEVADGILAYVRGDQ